MLTIYIRNDGTGTEEVGNYEWQAMVRFETIASGRVEGHPRAVGWERLVQRIIDQAMGDKVCHSTRTEQARIVTGASER